MTSRPEGKDGFRLGHHASLDGIRAVAVLSVLAVHYYNLVPFRGGFLGVDIFFVLSGFLITAILLQEHDRTGRIRLRAFYMRRALRLFPALAVCAVAVLAYVLIARPVGAVRSNLEELFAVIGYFDNWYQAFANPPLGLFSHGWSLSVEEQFYLLWPLLLLVGLRRGPKTTFRIAAAGAVACAIARGAEWHSGVFARYVYASLEGRSSELLIGAALAVAFAQGRLAGPRARQVGRAALLPALALLAGFLMFAEPLGSYVYEGGAVAFAAALAVVIANLVIWPLHPLVWLLELRPLVAVGRVSYGLYLWHLPILVVVREHTSRNLTAAAIAFPLTLVVTAASYRYVELRFLRRKRRYQADAEELPVPAAAPMLA